MIKNKRNSLISGVSCAVPGCNATRRKETTKQFFRFPNKNKEIFNKWIKKCSIPSSNLNRHLIICGIHFNESDIGKRKLRNGAVPNLFLPELPMEIDLNDMNIELQNDCKNNLNQAAQDANITGVLTSNVKSETSNYNDAFIAPQFTNIKTYSYKESSPPTELTIFDFENIRTPSTSPKKYLFTDSSPPVIPQSCVDCLKHIKNCRFYQKKNKALKKKNQLMKKKLYELRRHHFISQKKKPINNEIDKLNIGNDAKNFTKMLIREHKNLGYPEDQRQIAQCLYFTSPGCYSLPTMKKTEQPNNTKTEPSNDLPVLVKNPNMVTIYNSDILFKQKPGLIQTDLQNESCQPLLACKDIKKEIDDIPIDIITAKQIKIEKDLLKITPMPSEGLIQCLNNDVNIAGMMSAEIETSIKPYEDHSKPITETLIDDENHNNDGIVESIKIELPITPLAANLFVSSDDGIYIPSPKRIKIDSESNFPMPVRIKIENDSLNIASKLSNTEPINIREMINNNLSKLKLASEQSVRSPSPVINPLASQHVDISKSIPEIVNIEKESFEIVHILPDENIQCTSKSNTGMALIQNQSTTSEDISKNQKSEFFNLSSVSPYETITNIIKEEHDEDSEDNDYFGPYEVIDVADVNDDESIPKPIQLADQSETVTSNKTFMFGTDALVKSWIMWKIETPNERQIRLTKERTERWNANHSQKNTTTSFIKQNLRKLKNSKNPKISSSLKSDNNDSV